MYSEIRVVSVWRNHIEEPLPVKERDVARCLMAFYFFSLRSVLWLSHFLQPASHEGARLFGTRLAELTASKGRRKGGILGIGNHEQCSINDRWRSWKPPCLAYRIIVGSTKYIVLDQHNLGSSN